MRCIKRFILSCERAAQILYLHVIENEPIILRPPREIWSSSSQFFVASTESSCGRKTSADQLKLIKVRSYSNYCDLLYQIHIFQMQIFVTDGLVPADRITAFVFEPKLTFLRLLPRNPSFIKTYVRKTHPSLSVQGTLHLHTIVLTAISMSSFTSVLHRCSSRNCSELVGPVALAKRSDISVEV
jgi:hypothetical protein